MPQRLQLPAIDAVTVAARAAAAATPREREVHVVAAEQDVIADGDALEREIAIPLGDRESG